MRDVTTRSTSSTDFRCFSRVCGSRLPRTFSQWSQERSCTATTPPDDVSGARTFRLQWTLSLRPFPLRFSSSVCVHAHGLLSSARVPLRPRQLLVHPEENPSLLWEREGY